jgi:predicted RNA binding protein YcfA (HicA-like mRNA interferase family)
MNRDIQAILDAAKKAGWSVTKTNGGHWQLRSPDKRVPLIVAPNSPSDWRGLKNLKSLLRKNGVFV